MAAIRPASGELDTSIKTHINSPPSSWMSAFLRTKEGISTYHNKASMLQLVAAAHPIRGGTAPTMAPIHVLASVLVLERV